MAVVAKGVFTSPVTLSGFGQASDGQQVTEAGERWLVAGNGPGNGLYVTQAGAWVRAPELNESGDFVWGNDNTVVRVRGGNEWGMSEFGYNGIDNPTIGLDTLYFAVRLKYYASSTATELTSYIEGLGLSFVDLTTVSLSPGRTYVSGLGKVLTVEANQTATRLTGNNALYYAYLEEYPAGSGLGRLRLITTAPGAPYLGSARTQSDDTTARYLGMLRNDGAGALIPFGCELMGDGTVFYQYTMNHLSGVPPVFQGTATTNTPTDIGPDAAIAANRLVSPATQTVHLLVETTANHVAVGMPYVAGAVPAVAVPPSALAYVFARLSEEQEIYYKNFNAAGQTSLYVAGYFDRR